MNNKLIVNYDVYIMHLLMYIVTSEVLSTFASTSDIRGLHKIVIN